MSVDTSNKLFEKLSSVIPLCALLLSFKVVITELRVVLKRISVVEDINAISINTTGYLKIENHQP